jgi:hypothetical protein
MECNVTPYNNKCGDLMVGVFAYVLEVEDQTSQMVCVVINSGKLIKYFPM